MAPSVMISIARSGILARDRPSLCVERILACIEPQRPDVLELEWPHHDSIDLPVPGTRQADLFTVAHGILSSAAVIPALAGMIGGRWIREHLSEQRFRTVFFVTLFALGVYIVANVVRVFVDSKFWAGIFAAI